MLAPTAMEATMADEQETTEGRYKKPPRDWTEEELADLSDFLRALGWGLPKESDHDR